MEYSIKMHSILFCIILIFQNFSCMHELRKQFENQVLTIDTLQSEKRAVIKCHENVGSVPQLFHFSLIYDRIFIFIFPIEIHLSLLHKSFRHIFVYT